MSHEIRRRKLAQQPTGWPDSVHPVLQRVYAARGVTDPADIERRLSHLLHPRDLGSIAEATQLLNQAILDNKSICVAGDYDCDGATGAAVAVRGLRLLGATNVSFIVPNRFLHGYGLSPALVDAMDPQPDVIVTVDSGTSSVEGVAHANAKGIMVIITDHHLPGDNLPQAAAIVNPNLNGDAFPSKHLAGVGVMFYLLLSLRAHQRALNPQDGQADLAELLDLVAVGTIADLVQLDRNNRIIVDAGLRRIRAGKAHAGVNELIRASGKNPETLIASDVAFSIAPRLNAAGRLENMSLGVETLLCDIPADAENYVKQLDAINRERRDLQATMIAQAETIVASTEDTPAVGVVVHNEGWHAGVVGLVASKLKESLHRPVIAFASAGEDHPDEVRGSGRSIEGFHLRDALAVVDARHPGMILKFGGHAMAAGLSLKTADIPAFSAAFDQAAMAALTEEHLQAALYTDGELLAGEFTLEVAQLLRAGGPWGQAFPEPLFDGVFECVGWRLMGENHLRLMLEDPRDGTILEAIQFSGFHGESPPDTVRAVFELTVDEWLGKERLKLMVKHIESI
jgi:single-stranded-DNA-specific exonuclease